MKTQYKYIYFKVTDEKPKTKVWGCFNNSTCSLLGHVKWYAPWRHYCYFPATIAVYSEGCLRDICRFIDQLKLKNE